MNRAAALTKREFQMAEMLAWGAAKKEVADKLCVSTRTVETTARNIYDKIGIQKATELCVWWFTTQCGVPLSLSPFKKGLISVFMLIIIVVTEVNHLNSTIMVRPARTSMRTAKPQRSRRKEDYYYGC